MDSCVVLVAGAGPTGLALACGLLASGVAVRVVDGAAGPASTSRALGLQPRGVEVLERAGALGDLEQRSNPVRQVAVDLGGRTTARLRLGQTTNLVPRPGLIVSQAEIEANLRRRLAQLGGTVEWGRAVLAGRQDDEGVIVELSGGRTTRCEWLVGCDGAHSRVRKLAGIGFPGVQLIERFLLADVHADLPVTRDTVSVWLRGAEMLAAFPLPGADLWRLMAPAPDGADQELGAQAVLGLLLGRLQERTGWPVSAATAEWTSTFRIHRRLAERFRQGRVLLAGDAAHIHSPVGGQGLNTGLGDAENLAWKLALVARERAAPALLDSYEAERRPIAAEVLESTSAMTRMVLGESRLARVLRDRVFVPSLNSPLVQRVLWEQASQLKVSYRSGPLALRANRPLLPRPRPGDRVPNLACRQPGGSPTRLHAELGSRWVLLTPPPSTPQAAAATQGCVDLTRQRLGPDRVTVLTPTSALGPHLLLVRPDAHLGWRGHPSTAVLDGWLTGVLDEGRASCGRSRATGRQHERTVTAGAVAR